MPYFNLISEAIYQIFKFHNKHSDENIVENMNFLKSNLVSVWCDCSSNFNQEMLIANYYNLLTDREKKLI